MKSKILPAIVASLLLATPAFAARPHDTNDHHRPKHARTVHETGSRANKAMRGHHDRNVTINRNRNLTINRNRNRTVIRNRNVTVNRNVTIDNRNRGSHYDNRNIRIDRNRNGNHRGDVRGGRFHGRYDHRPPNFVFRDYRHHRNYTWDVRVYRRVWHAPRRYHWGYYRRPAHWYAHRWTSGDYIPQAWFARDYWIDNFDAIGLVGPPDGCVWVRVGDDALLIDEDTGEVIQVAYSIFD